MNNQKNTDKTSQQIDEERVIQTNSNLGLVDARPGESTFQTGTKNHSNELDHAYSIDEDLKAGDPDIIRSTNDLKKTLELENENLTFDNNTSEVKK